MYWSLSLWSDICTGDSLNRDTVAEGAHPFADRTALSLSVTHQLGDGRWASAALHLFPLPLQSVTQQHMASDFRWALDGLLYKTDFIP